MDNATGGARQRARALAHTAGCVLDTLEQRVLLSGDGLSATYWNNASSTYASSLNFSGSSITRVDPTINFNWGDGSPNVAINRDTFSARWSGQIAIPATATYTFYANTGDGVKLWVNGALVIDNWRDQPTTETTGRISLTGGQNYDIRMEYYDHTGKAAAQLRWSSDTIAKAIVPQSVLYSSSVPIAPALSAAAATNVPKVTLSWAGGSTGTQGYAIDRSTNGVSFVELVRVGATISTYTDVSNLAPQTSYTYRIRALDATGMSTASAPVTVVTADFQVLDGLCFLNKPSLLGTGIDGVYVAYENEFFAAGDMARLQPNEAATRAVADRASALNEPLAIDIECWPTDIRSATDAQVQSTIDKFAQVIAWVRNERPGLSLGIYGLFSSAANDPAAVAADTRLASLASQVDYLFPSLYTVPDNPIQWGTNAALVLQEARSFAKPVYPFIWMDYSDPAFTGGDAARPSLPADYWRMQLALVRRLADGVVFWGGYLKPWDSTAPWWQVTESFAAANDPATLTLAAPSNIIATASTGRISLNWTNSSAGAAGVAIERSADGVTFATLAMVAPGATTYTDFRVTGQASYYRLRASNWVGDSAPSATVSAIAPRDATAQTQAESANAQSGVIPAYWVMGGLTQGGWIKYANMDFGSGVNTCSATLASAQSGGSIELRLDSPTAPVAGTLMVVSTGGVYRFAQQSMGVSGVSGVHDLYLTFKGTSVGNLDSFRFAATVPPAAPTGLSAIPGPSQVALKWTDTSGGTASFKIERSANNVDFTQIGSVRAGSSTYTDLNPGGGSTLYYRVRANIVSAGDSTPSNVASAVIYRDARITTQAASFDAQNAVDTTGPVLMGLCGGAWLKYSAVDFGAGVSSFTADVGVPAAYAGGQIEVRLDSPTGTLVGTLTVAGTGQWSTLVPQTTAIAGATGRHNLYLVFRGSLSVAHFDWFKFA